MGVRYRIASRPYHSDIRFEFPTRAERDVFKMIIGANLHLAHKMTAARSEHLHDAIREGERTQLTDLKVEAVKGFDAAAKAILPTETPDEARAREFREFRTWYLEERKAEQAVPSEGPQLPEA